MKLPSRCVASLLALGTAALVGCQPAQPSPSAPPAKPAEKAAPAAKPAEKTAPAAKPAASPAVKPAEKTEVSFAGKTIRVIVGYAAGGGFDVSARLLARHMGKHLPGNPTLVVENMEGAGSLIAANYIYNRADKDGTVFGTFNEVQLLNQLIGLQGVQYDFGKFSWLGSLFSSTSACVARKDTGVTEFRQLLDGKQLIVGSTAPGSNTEDYPKAIKAATGANLKIVSGYDGTAKIRLAVEAKEVDGACWTWESIKSTAQHWLEGEALVTVLTQQAPTKHPDIQNVPMTEEFAKTEADKKLLRAVVAPGAISKPFGAPPGVQAARLETLQKAFHDTLRDPAFLDDAKQAKLDLDPKDAKTLLTIVSDVLSMDKETAGRLNEVLK